MFGKTFGVGTLVRRQRSSLSVTAEHAPGMSSVAPDGCTEHYSKGLHYTSFVGA
jgi:hypothetical protein